MQQVKIYIETDSSSPKATEKHYGYVLEVMVSGQAVTREGFGKITGTYHQPGSDTRPQPTQTI